MTLCEPNAHDWQKIVTTTTASAIPSAPTWHCRRCGIIMVGVDTIAWGTAPYTAVIAPIGPA